MAVLLLWNSESAPSEVVKRISAAAGNDELLSVVKSVSDQHPEKFSILVLQKTHFENANLPSVVKGLEGFEELGLTDIYHRFLARSGSAEGERLQVTLVSPCTITHVRKYIDVPMRMVSESASDFLNFTVPYVSQLPPERTAWIQKVLNKESEAEVALIHDNDPEQGFIITPDSKWDQKTVASLYYLALVQNAGIRCLRDLRPKHLPMLKRIREAARRLIPQRYPEIQADRLRFYVHYFPSYFHFHIHIVNTQYVGLMGGTVGQCHLLEDIIENIENIDPEYYAKRTLHFGLHESHDLYASLKKCEQ